MKTKIAGLASTVLLLLTPISGAFSAIAESRMVQASTPWDYDTENPGLSEYDQLLQNAGPSDGQIDWYPAEHFASSKNIRPSLLVKQLIDLSIATNDATSKESKVLFSGTNGSSANDAKVYEKYNLAYSFIAQLLSFNNQRVGRGAYLKQGFESTNGKNKGSFHSEDIISETRRNPDGKILGIPKKGEGINISDILGRAVFGKSDDAYAQLYINGYDNTVQNAPNIIRETTTSITIVAQSKLIGRKATAIFKLNNKTFNNLPDEVLLENDLDSSPSFNGVWGHDNIPSNEAKHDGDSTNGTFNQRGNLVTGLTDAQKGLLSNGGSSAWIDPKTGSGTIVVPYGTSAAEIAKKIKQLGYKSNYNISNVAPMKAIHGDFYGNGNPGTPAALSTDQNSYSVSSLGDQSNYHDLVSDHDAMYAAVADPRVEEDKTTTIGIKRNFSNSLLKSPFNTSTEVDQYDNETAGKILNQGLPSSSSGASHNRNEIIEETKDFPWPAYATNDSLQASEGAGYSHSLNSEPVTSSSLVAQYNGQAPKGGLATYPFGGEEDFSHPVFGGFGGNKSENVDPKMANDALGNVVHVFEPSSGNKTAESPFKVREAWDDTHAIFGMAPFTGLTEDEIKNQIANNGSFDNTSGAQLKKSFTFNMPLNNTVMKSYRNPYSTVISTALPFSKSDNTEFKQGEQYHGFGSNSTDMNNTPNSFSGHYLDNEETPPTNPWYENSEGYKLSNGTFADSGPMDVSGFNMKLHASEDTNSTRRPLHLSQVTWSEDWSDYDNNNAEIGLHNVKNNLEDRKKYENWIKETSAGSKTLEGNTSSSTVTDSTANTRPDITVQNTTNNNGRIEYHIQMIGNGSGNNNTPTQHGNYIDAHNEKYTNPAEYYKEYTSPDSSTLWVNQIPTAQTVCENTYNVTKKRTVRHLQLAKNVGYVLINRADLSESQAKKLSQYQIPNKASDPNKLDGIANDADFANEINRPLIPLVNDDPTYRGGLLGVQSIRNSDNSGNLRKQVKAGSIYERTLSAGAELLVPRRGEYNNPREGVIKNDDKQNGTPSSGQFATDTDLHYGLAWNDSSDLPQVKIRRSLNVQYLVPVSVARTATTEYKEEDHADATHSTTHSNGVTHHYYNYNNISYKRTIITSYSNYKLFLGNVKLANYGSGMTDGSNGEVKQDNQTIGYNHIANDGLLSGGTSGYNYIYTKNAIKDILPVNNQIAYTRVDNSYPHYDSELFDHGSNTKSITVKQGDKNLGFVGNTEEKDRLSDLESDSHKFVGSSDDYSIGIVKAPSNLFDTNNGTLIYKGADDFSRDTENEADNKLGMNPMVDAPENNNGMRIGDVKSYATLAQAYNIEINGNKAVGKADDTAKNKGDRVALVQQLLDNGGDAGAYYYIPSLPRLYEHWNDARINVVVYNKAAVPAPSKNETKPSFSATDVSASSDPFSDSLRPHTTVYDDGAVLKESEVPQNFKNLLTRELVAGNPDLVTSDGKVATAKLQQILISTFLDSWQQNDSSINQSNPGANSPLYLFGGFGISNSDSKNSYIQWPDGYTTPTLNSSKYHEAITLYSGDFYRGSKDLKTTGSEIIKGIPASTLKADVSQVDLSKAGVYPVVYTYTNPSNPKDSASITVPVTVTDAAAPVFAFQGGRDQSIKVGMSFDRNAYKVVGSRQIYNKYQGNYSDLVNYEGIAKNSKGEPDVTISGDVDTQTPGVYQLTYKATSIGGAVTTVKRNITVQPRKTPKDDWKVSDFASVGYINYVPNYGINVWNAPAGTFTGQRLTHGTSWKIFKKAVDAQGKVYYNVGKNQWIDGAYVSFKPISRLQSLKGIVTINYVPGYGVNLWKAPKTTGGYYKGRKLKHGTPWKVFGIQDGFYKVGSNQWIQAKYAKLQAK